jgi:hypothetical protein
MWKIMKCLGEYIQYFLLSPIHDFEAAKRLTFTGINTYTVWEMVGTAMSFNFLIYNQINIYFTHHCILYHSQTLKIKCD